MRMRLKSEIRRRRQARIEELKMLLSRPDSSESEQAAPLRSAVRSAASEMSQAGSAEHKSAAPPSAPMAVPPPRDPEEAWKRRMAAWSGQPLAELAEKDSQGGMRKRQLPAWGGLSFTSVFLSVMLFILVWGLYQLQEGWALRLQASVQKVLQEPFDVQEAANWYRSMFGGSYPSWIPAMRGDEQGEETRAVIKDLAEVLQAPGKGKIVTPFDVNGQGVLIQMPADAPVSAAAKGRVVFQGQTSSGLTVVIQHPDHVRTVYGWLDGAEVAENDWVEQGDLIARGVQEKGAAGNGVLYFSVRVDDAYVNPADVVDFD